MHKVISNLRQIQSESLHELKHVCRDYVKNPMCCFKKCNNSIVILEKQHMTKTNEHRSGIIDKKFAKFRMNYGKTVAIINVIDPRIKLFNISSRYKRSYITYEVNKLVYADAFDENPIKIMTNGIHYFKSLEGAFFFRGPHVSMRYTGEWFEWYFSGALMRYGFYVNGNLIGSWIEYNKDDTININGFRI
jgi:antitoxin component YwqK of YwqJK toxin-antitoxin module